MAQIFHPATNTISRASIFGALLALLLVAWVSAGIQRSSYVTEVNVVREQPVPFSHEHHVAGLGIDCRYCHTSVTTSAFAGIPSTRTCMTCHSQVWTEAEALGPVRSSWSTGVPLRWTRVHDLPDFVYFDHSIHVRKGVACSTCHGPVDRMPGVFKAHSFYMEWCLDCHRRPEGRLRPRERVFDTAWTPPPDQPPPSGQQEAERRLVEEYGIRTHQLENCSICHR